LETEDLTQFNLEDFHQILQHDSLLERFAYRKQTGMVNRKDFIKLKGTKGQLAHDEAKAEIGNDQIGFKCLHYSVTESNGHVEITIVKKLQSDLSVGVRTVADSATYPKDYTHFDEIIPFRKRDTEQKISVQIIDDAEWEPDLDFFVELYDPNTLARLPGDDTRTRVTILDEDFPGTIGFLSTDVRVNKDQEDVEIVIVRKEDADGNISCMVETEPLHDSNNAANAQE